MYSSLLISDLLNYASFISRIWEDSSLRKSVMIYKECVYIWEWKTRVPICFPVDCLLLWDILREQFNRRKTYSSSQFRGLLFKALAPIVSGPEVTEHHGKENMGSRIAYLRASRKQKMCPSESYPASLSPTKLCFPQQHILPQSVLEIWIQRWSISECVRFLLTYPGHSFTGTPRGMLHWSHRNLSFSNEHSGLTIAFIKPTLM